MTNLLISLSEVLLSNGFPLLSKLLEDTKLDNSIDTLKYIEQKSNISLTDNLDTLPELSLEDLTKIDEIISKNSLEVEQCLCGNSEVILKDIANARDLQNHHLENYTKTLLEKGPDVAKGLWLSANFIYIYAGIISLFIFVYIFAITFMDISENNLRFADGSLGNFYGILNVLVGFFFGAAFQQAINNKNKS